MAHGATLPDTTTTLTAVADSYVESASVWNNYGKIQYLRASTGRDGLLRFDLASLSDKEVVKAELRVTPVAPFPLPLSVSSLLDNGWKEYGVTYYNRPATVVAALGSLDGSSGAQMALDVTSAVRTFQGQPMTLKLSSTNTDKLAYLNTRESANPPVLVITSHPRTVTLAPSADSHVDPAAPASNFASASQLQIDGLPASRAYLKFDLSALTAKNVLGATLRIKPVQQHGGTVYVRVLQSTDTNVNVLTFNSQPALLPDYVALQTTVGADGWQEFDLTALVKASGLLPLALELDGDSGQPLNFPSLEAGLDAPQLVVAYSKAAVVPPPQVAVPPLKVGINIETPSYYGTEVPLVDLMKQGHEWYTGCQSWRDSYCNAGQFRPGGGSFDTKEQDLLNVDANGWVKTLPAPADGITTKVNYTTVATLIPSSLSPQWPSGRMTVLYEGEGTLYYSFSNGTLVKNNALSSPGRDVLDISLAAGKPAGTAMQLMITATDPKKTGNYLRNIRVLPPGGVCSDNVAQYCRNDAAGASCNPTATCDDFEQVYQSKPFDPRFLANIQRFDTLRFMGYQNTNDANNEIEWSDRTLPGNYTWQRMNYHHNPAENVVAMGNTLSRNVWINIPLRASDDYVTQLATLVHNQLAAGLKVYVEYGNEVWNTAFAGGNWVEAQGVARWPFAANTAYEKRLQWQGVRTAQ
ncbi:MAG: DNRLRE domain-containing protein, partial [Leptothrix sp. (in: b-proteobacteria)]